MPEKQLTRILLPPNINTKQKQWTDIAGNVLALLEFVLWKQHWKYVPFVLKHGADPNVESGDFFIETPLYFAIDSSQWNTVALLVQHGASLTKTNFSADRTPLSSCLESEVPIEIVKMLMPPKTDDSDTEVCRVIAYLLLNTLEEKYDCQLVIMRYLLQNLRPLKLESIRIPGDQEMLINGRTIDIASIIDIEYSTPQIRSLFFEMLCHLLQETYLSMNLAIEYNDDSESLNNDIIGAQFSTLSHKLTRHPPSLFKLSTLTVKQSMTTYDDRDFYSLELPGRVISRLKWAELAIDLYDMWHPFQMTWDESRSDL